MCRSMYSRKTWTNTSEQLRAEHLRRLACACARPSRRPHLARGKRVKALQELAAELRFNWRESFERRIKRPHGQRGYSSDLPSRLPFGPHFLAPFLRIFV